MIKNYEDQNNIALLNWLLYIKKIYPINNINSLNRIITVAKRLNLLKNSNFIITVAGTNGKGSTCFLLEKILLYSGYNVGLYTSPHLLYYHERIRINGKSIQNSDVHIAVFKEIDKIRGNIFLTFFEFITLAALFIFQSYTLDVLILEVGIGGRLDATNIMNANIAIITNINLDHTLLLGNNTNDIAYEKVGIFRKNIPVIIGDYNIPYAIYQASNLLQNSLQRVLCEWYWVRDHNFWNFYDGNGSLEKLHIPSILLSNAAIAISAIRSTQFNIKYNNIQKALKNVFLPGRFHIILYEPYVVLDVAHNPHAAYCLYKQLKQFLFKKNNTKIYCVISMIPNKDIKTFISILSDLVHVWYYSPLQNNHNIPIVNLKKYLPKNSIDCFSVSHALSSLITVVNKKDMILVIGSFYTVSEAMIFFKNKYGINI